MKISREPVVIVQALLVPIALAFVLLFHLPETTVGVINALILAVGGAIAALGVSVDALLPLLGGLAKAVLAVLLAFGLHVSDEWQAFVLTVISVIVGFLTRPQVTAKVPPSVRITSGATYDTPSRPAA